jgi:hypothetical protein
VLAQRGQFHQSILAQHLTPDSSIYRDWLQQVTSAFILAGYFRNRGGKPGGGPTLQHAHSAGFATLLLRLFSRSDYTRLCRTDSGHGNQEFQGTG